MKIFALASLAAIGGLAACNYIGDSNGCVYGYNWNSPQKDCPFGPPPPSGVNGGNCTPEVLDKTSKDCDGLTWSGKVWPTVLSGKCAISGCHINGTVPATAPVLAGDPATVFKALESYKNYDCGTYVSSSTPEKSQIVNNLKGVAGAGAQMPYMGMLGDDDIKTVETWVKCGAPQ